MKRSVLSCAAITGAALVVSCLAPAAADAAAGKAGVPQAHVAAHQSTSAKAAGITPSLLKGYQIVTSALLTSNPNGQTSGSAACPQGTKVVGGGAVISGSDLGENLNGSVPVDTRTWRVFVNNATAGQGSFTVYAVCVANLRGWQLVSGASIVNGAGLQTVATVDCPDGTVPLGGGGVGSSFETGANLNSSVALGSGWRVDMNNNTGSDENATALAICAEAPKKYSQVAVRTGTTVKPGTQNSSLVKCPKGTVAFGGGSFSSSSSVLVNLNSSFANSSITWRSYQNNGSTAKSTVSASVVCGKAESAA